MQNLFEQVKKRLSLFDYASRVMQLKPSGVHKYAGLCPFHAEKTPSFFVDQEKDLFYCFGCSCGGDLFEFYQKFHRVDSKDALRALMQMCGLEFEHTANKKTDLIKMKDFFKSNLQQVHIDYLHSRGVNSESIQKFEIGYAPEVETTKNFIKIHKLNLDDYNFGSYFWKMFEKRIVFPIFNRFGQLCSFGARTLNEKSERAKYVNGSASEYFDKSKILYGANWYRASQQDLYVTEGYLDVILLFQAGFNAVAAMGTAFGDAHVQQSLDLSNHLIVIMDGDSAGRRSSAKIAYMALEFLKIGKKISFIELKNGEDAASFIQNGGSVSELKKIELCEYIFNIEYSNIALKSDNAFDTFDNIKIQNQKTSKPEADISPDTAAFVFENLMNLAKKITNKTLQSEYKNKWRQLWWKKKLENRNLSKKLSSGFMSRKYANADFGLQSLRRETLVLLLFKYILMYPEILDEVAESFAQLPLESEFQEQIVRLLSGIELGEQFLLKVEQIGVQDAFETSSQALEMWHKVASRLSDDGSEKDEQAKYLEDNFSSAAWDNFKKWLDQKED